MEFTSDLIGWGVGVLGAAWIFYKEVYLKKQDAKIEKGRAMTELDIDRQKAKDQLENTTQQTTLEAYTKLNEKVFGMFENYMTAIQKDVSHIKSVTTHNKNMMDKFERDHEEILNAVKQSGCKTVE